MSDEVKVSESAKPRKWRDLSIWLAWVAGMFFVVMLVTSQRAVFASPPSHLWTASVALIFGSLFFGVWKLARAAFNWRTARRLLIGMAVLVTLVAVFYTVENWRGKRLWEKTWRELAAQGIEMDWAKYVPPPVPDEQNVFKAPKMQQWFVGRGINELGSRLGSPLFPETGDVIAEVVIIPPDTDPATVQADLVLQYNFPILDLPEAAGASSPPVIPLLELKDVPLAEAIADLAGQAGVTYVVDRNVELPADIRVTVRWENIRADEALRALLANYGLHLAMRSQGGHFRITKITPYSDVYITPAARERLSPLVRGVIEERNKSFAGQCATGAVLNAVLFSERPAGRVKPVRLAVQSGAVSNATVRNFLFGIPPHQFEAQSAGSNLFRLLLSAPHCLAAEDYLAWSDRLQPEFELIREALKRPYSRMEGDYAPYQMPVPNFVCLRSLAQILSMRVQAFLLLNRPDDALRELSFLHDLRRILEAEPTGRPLTLVAAMINVAVRGLYVDVVADGVRLGAWKEPHLTAIQAQLASVNLPRLAASATDCERVATARMFETITAKQFAKVQQQYSGSKSFWPLLKDPQYLYLKFAPRGWIYQNLDRITRYHLRNTQSYDAATGLIVPDHARAVWTELDQLRWGPYTYLASWVLPNYSSMWRTVAMRQTLVNEGVIVCALERHRLKHGTYPATITELSPAFLEKIPGEIVNGQALKYRRADEGGFLLYSVGWNQTDDGGVPDPERDLGRGDWVWGAQ